MQDQPTLKLCPPTISSRVEASPPQKRYQIINSSNGDCYVLDRFENITYPIKRPTYITVKT